jgi:hypothetical protein
MITVILFNVITLIPFNIVTLIIVFAAGKLDLAHILYPNNPTANGGR